jgi:hypothetical protein
VSESRAASEALPSVENRGFSRSGFAATTCATIRPGLSSSLI